MSSVFQNKSRKLIQLGVGRVASGNGHILADAVLVDTVSVRQFGSCGFSVGLLVEVVEQVEEDDGVGRQKEKGDFRVGAARLQNHQGVRQDHHELDLIEN